MLKLNCITLNAPFVGTFSPQLGKETLEQSGQPSVPKLQLQSNLRATASARHTHIHHLPTHTFHIGGTVSHKINHNNLQSQYSLTHPPAGSQDFLLQAAIAAVC